MAKHPTGVGNFEIPAEIRNLAEQSVEQARRALDSFMTATQQAMNAWESQAAAARSGGKDVRRKAIQFAERNVANSLEFAQRLVKAKDADEVMRLQTEFIRAQMQALAEQAQELGQAVAQATMEAARPKF